jgi:murein DD-endopeptidase MepM/ murein hydrolase activator NlpD
VRSIRTPAPFRLAAATGLGLALAVLPARAHETGFPHTHDDPAESAPATGGAAIGAAAVPASVPADGAADVEMASRPDGTDLPIVAGDRLGPIVETRLLTVEPGDTLMAMLTGEGVGRTEAHYAIEALGDLVDLRRLQIGQEISVTVSVEGETVRLDALETMQTVEEVATVSRDPETDDFIAGAIENALETRASAASGTIDSSLYLAAVGEGVPDPVLIDAIRAYSYTVDFQRDFQPGDHFEILYEQDFHADGELARHGDILYARLVLSGRDYPIYRYEHGDGRIDYYNRDGESMRRVLMRTPIDGARISSNFGPRRHPILGYSRMHRGTDFAAPTGTPIYAAGDGVVEVIGRNSGYGNYIRLRHNGSLKTAYGHMNGFARGLSQGDRVRQGDVIGYVGSTGLSTGPHLHYEVLIDGAQVNPMNIDLPTGENLEGSELAQFRGLVEAIDQRFADLLPARQLAARPEFE